MGLVSWSHLWLYGLIGQELAGQHQRQARDGKWLHPLARIPFRLPTSLTCLSLGIFAQIVTQVVAQARQGLARQQ